MASLVCLIAVSLETARSLPDARLPWAMRSPIAVRMQAESGARGGRRGVLPRRLSIVDLSAAGAQPMISADGRWVIGYNGEIYNSDDIRRGPSLGSVAWRGHSDTETILESVAQRGVEATLDDINGMFAMALWDRRDKVLHLVRDRLGIKPLFVARKGARCYFASELKSLHASTPLHSRSTRHRSQASFVSATYRRPTRSIAVSKS